MNNSAEDTRVLIVGTGALATLFAFRLAAAGYGVTMLGTWQPGLSALREHGARTVDPFGSEKTFPVQVADGPRQCQGAKWAIVLVKSWQTERAAEQLARCLATDGLALTLQNGLGNYETLERLLGKSRVALGTTTVGATLLGPGLVKAAGEAHVSVQAHARVAALEAALTASGFTVERVIDTNSLLWKKLIINSAINPLTALLGVQNGELLRRPAARDLMRNLAQETAAVALAERVDLAPGDPATMVEDVAQRTAGNYSSMLQDVRRGAPTEIEAICGAVAQAGKRDGVPTPLNDACWRLIQALTQASQPTSAAQARKQTVPAA
jgi:2-dehydropantoate 2-reductase